LEKDRKMVFIYHIERNINFKKFKMCIELILAILYFLTILVVNYFLYRLIKNYFTNILYLFKLKRVFTVYQKN
jgi:hypothetical protein